MGLVSLVRGYRKVGGGGVFSFPFFSLVLLFAYRVADGTTWSRREADGRRARFDVDVFRGHFRRMDCKLP